MNPQGAIRGSNDVLIAYSAAFVLIPKFGTLNRGAVLKVLAAGNGGRRIIPAMFHAMRLTACAR